MDGTHVDPEVAPLYTLVVTVRTFEWLLSGVDQLVVLQLKRSTES